MVRSDSVLNHPLNAGSPEQILNYVCPRKFSKVSKKLSSFLPIKIWKKGTELNLKIQPNFD